jgi:hypothetical protein
MKRAVWLVVLFGLGGAVFAPVGAAEVTNDHFVVPGRFFPFPRDYGVVAVFSAIATAPDGKVYVGTSTYNHPSQLLELDPVTGRYRVAVDLGRVLPQDDAAFITHSKIHTFLELSADGNTVYFGTHTGEPEGLGEYSRRLSGGHFLAYDRRTGVVTDYGVGRPYESLMRVSLDEQGGRLYGLTFPRGHLVACDMASRRIRDYGKAAISGYSDPWVMADGKVYLASRLDEFSRFDPDKGEFDVLPLRLPDVAGEQQQLYFGCFSAVSADRRRLYGLVMPSFMAVEWNLAKPPGELRYLCGPVVAANIVPSPDGNTLYFFGRNGMIEKYDFKQRKHYTVGQILDGTNRLRGVWAACAGVGGKYYLGGNKAHELRNGKWQYIYGSWDASGVWEYDAAVEPKLAQPVQARPLPEKPKPAKTAETLLGFAELNPAIPYGESSLRAVLRLPDGALLGATVGRRSHLVLVEESAAAARKVGELPEGEFPAWGGLACDPQGRVWLGTVGDLETIYGMGKTPAGKVYQVTLDAARRKAALKRVAEPFAEDGISTMTLNPTGTELAGVTFPGGRLFTLSLPAGKAAERAVLVQDTRPQQADACAYRWMQIRVGRAVAYDRAGRLFAGADGQDLVWMEPGAEKTQRRPLPLSQEFRWAECEVNSLAPGPDGLVYVGTRRGYLLAFDPAATNFVNLGRPARQGNIRELCWSGRRLYGLCGDLYGDPALFSYARDDGYRLLSLPAPAGYWKQYLNDSYETLALEPDSALWLGGAGRMTAVLKMRL